MSKVKLLKASAGSGKTYRLSYEYIKGVIENAEQYRSTLAVTFTNKATEEMKRRIIGEINDLANGKTKTGKNPEFMDKLCQEFKISKEEVSRRATKVRSRILHDYSHFTILTIDKFFQRIIRAFIRELGIESDFTLELKTDSVLSGAADKLIEETVTDKELRTWLIDFIEEQISDGKHWRVHEEITKLGKEIFKEDFFELTAQAPTREKMQEIINISKKQADEVTKKMVTAAQKALEIIAEANLSVEDFLGSSRSFAVYFQKVASGTVTSRYGEQVRKALEPDSAWCTKKSLRASDIKAVEPTLRPLLTEICSLYDNNIQYINTAELVRENYRVFAILTDLSRHIRDLCRTRNVMLISDTNRIINKLIAENETPFIFEKVGNTFSNYMIDEFQDTSLSQWNNFYPLIVNALSQSEKSPVLIVGDVKQSIYRWRGGDWKILGRTVSEKFADTETINLDTNYRSQGIVINFNNNIINQSVKLDNAQLNNELDIANENNLISGTLLSELENLLSNAYENSFQNVSKPEREQQGYVRVLQYDKKQKEEQTETISPAGRHTISIIEELQERGYSPRDIAVIVRYNTEAAEIAAALLARKGENPDSHYRYDVVTQEALAIGSSPAVRFIAACLRVAVNSGDNISRAIISKYLNGTVSRDFSPEDENFFANLRMKSLEEAFESVMLRYLPQGDPQSIAYLQAFHEQVINFASTKISDIPLFLRWWDDTGCAESVNMPAGQDAITIITIHKAKGLQYPAVILPFANWDMNPKAAKTMMWVKTDVEPFSKMGYMPVKYKKTVAESYFAPYFFNEKVYAHVDNVNTLYVALTRAEQELYVMIPRASKNMSNGVGDLMLSCMGEGENGVSLDDMNGRIRYTPETVYEFGEPMQHTVTETDNGNYATIYPSFAFDGKIRLKRASERFFADDDTENDDIQSKVSPRAYGRIMHRVFESLVTLDDVPQSISTLISDGIISENEREGIEVRIAGIMENDLIKSWFSGQWKTIRNENDIIVPGASAALRRPDRVMIDGRRAVVVDYKFGAARAEHSRQVTDYVNLMKQMGYDEVAGYIWYVETGVVEPVA